MLIIFPVQTPGYQFFFDIRRTASPRFVQVILACNSRYANACGINAKCRDDVSFAKFQINEQAYA